MGPEKLMKYTDEGRLITDAKFKPYEVGLCPDCLRVVNERTERRDNRGLLTRQPDVIPDWGNELAPIGEYCRQVSGNSFFLDQQVSNEETKDSYTPSFSPSPSPAPSPAPSPPPKPKLEITDSGVAVARRPNRIHEHLMQIRARQARDIDAKCQKWGFDFRNGVPLAQDGDESVPTTYINYNDVDELEELELAHAYFQDKLIFPAAVNDQYRAQQALI